MKLNYNGFTGLFGSSTILHCNFAQRYSRTISCFQGELPTTIGYLRALKDVRLHVNALRGSVPTEIGHLTNLEELHVGDQKADGITGPLPSEMGNLIKLKVLYMPTNNIEYVLFENGRECLAGAIVLT